MIAIKSCNLLSFLTPVIDKMKEKNVYLVNKMQLSENFGQLPRRAKKSVMLHI